MKKLFIILLSIILLSSCATTHTFYKKEWSNNETTISYDKKITIEPYGIFNSNKKVDGVSYKLSVGNLIISAIFSETIVVPAVLCGWFLWEPDGVNDTSVFDKKAKK